jgi:hypothetical protein
MIRIRRGTRWVQERAGRMLALDLGRPSEALPYLAERGGPVCDALLAGPTDRRRGGDGRCYDQACMWRARVPRQDPGVASSPHNLAE